MFLQLASTLADDIRRGRLQPGEQLPGSRELAALQFRIPDGGMALWARADAGINIAEWACAAEREGVLFFDSRRYDFLQREQPCIRLGFTYNDETELNEAARRMARALAQTRALPSKQRDANNSVRNVSSAPSRASIV